MTWSIIPARAASLLRSASRLLSNFYVSCPTVRIKIRILDGTGRGLARVSPSAGSRQTDHRVMGVVRLRQLTLHHAGGDVHLFQILRPGHCSR